MADSQEGAILVGVVPFEDASSSSSNELASGPVARRKIGSSDRGMRQIASLLQENRSLDCGFGGPVAPQLASRGRRAAKRSCELKREARHLAVAS